MSSDRFGLAHDVQQGAVPSASPNQHKRKRSAAGAALPPSPTSAHDSLHAPFPNVKRIKIESRDAPPKPPAVATTTAYPALGRAGDHAPYIASPPSSPVLSAAAPPSATDDAAMERVKDIVQYQFGYEILTKHQELRLIEQEMAKCQVALEQLRRCHLIPYPTACPTPTQMLDIASGRGIAVRPHPGAAVAKWAAPFGVVDGPYARHYAKWLIPDPVFDGPLPNWPGLAPTARSKGAVTAEARATRNSLPDSGRGRPTRGLGGQKLHALSNGYPQPKDKAGPCVLKRADGKVVKLVCIDCHRENFSSTQGFINHCRIAHKRDFKSHEEAAVHCGHPIDAEAPPKKTDAQAPGAVTTAAVAGAVAGVAASAASTATAATAATAPVAVSSAAAAAAAAAAVAAATTCLPAPSPAVPGQVYPLARNDSEAVNSLLRHIEESFQQYKSAAIPQSEPVVKREAVPAAGAFVGSDKAPFLSRFMQEMNMTGNLQECVEEAKDVVDVDEDFLWTPEEELTPEPTPAAAKRVPSRQTKAAMAFVSMDGSAGSDASSRRSSSNSLSSQMSYETPSVCTTVDFDKSEGSSGGGPLYDDDVMAMELSPNTIASNNAPSLVSDDGEYDDTDDGSASEASDTDLESVSDVAEINMVEDEDDAHETPRPLRHHRSKAGPTAMKLKKDEPKHVTFVGPVTGPDNMDQRQ